MITTAPLKRLMVENDFSTHIVASLTGMNEQTVNKILNNQSLTKEHIEKLCKLFNCQPCDIIEFTDTEAKGHWVYVEDK